MNKENLLKMATFLNGPAIPGFDINDSKKCAIGHIQEAIPEATLETSYFLGQKYPSYLKTSMKAFNISAEDVAALFGGTRIDGWDSPCIDLREKKNMLQYSGSPEDQYLVAKNILKYVDEH